MLGSGGSGEEVEIGVGETAEWLSDVAHGYAALSDEPVESVLVTLQVTAGCRATHEV